MGASGDAAEQVVRMSLEGSEYALRIAGKGAKELAVFLYAAAQGSKRTKGRTRLVSLLKSGKELKVFSLPESYLKRFAQEAKKYGVLYAALRGIKKSGDGITDIMVRAEDASKINRIFERFSIPAVDTAALRHEILREAGQRAEQSRDAPDTPAEVIEERQQAAPQAEKPHSENPTALPQNPTRADMAKENRSEAISAERTTSGREGFPDTRNKPSVRKTMDDMRAQRGRQDSSPERGKSDINPDQSKSGKIIEFPHRDTNKTNPNKPKGR